MAAASAKMHAGMAVAGAAAAKVAKATALAVAAVGVAAVVGGKKAIDAYSDLSESLNAVDKIFGKSQDKIIKWGKANANSFGLSRSAFHSLAVPLGAGLKNAGLSLDATSTHTIKLTERASDMASVFNTEVSDALEAIQAGLRGEADPLEKFGVGLSAAKVEARALADTGKKVAKELTDQERMLARINLIMDQTNDTAGDFRNTSGELANAQRIAAARSEDLAAKIGKQLAPVMETLTKIKLALMQVLADHLLPALSRFTGWVKEEAIPRLKDFGGALKERFGGPVQDAARWVRDDLWPALKNAWNWIKTTAIPAIADFGKWVNEHIIKPLQNFVGFLREHVLPRVQDFVDILKKHIKPAIENAKAALKDLNVNFNQFKPILKAVGALLLVNIAAALVVVAAVVYGAALALRVLSNLLRHVVVPAWNTFTGSARAAGAWIKDVGTRVVGYVKTMASGIKRFTSGLWGGIRSGLAGAVNWVIDKINALIARINAIPGVDISRIPRIASSRATSGRNIGLEARAAGGPVNPFQSYLVGERGAEIITMGARGGHVTPNHQLNGPQQIFEIHVDMGDGVKRVFRHEMDQHDRSTKRRVIQARVT